MQPAPQPGQDTETNMLDPGYYRADVMELNEEQGII
jgi:hypothetical protein